MWKEKSTTQQNTREETTTATWAFASLMKNKNSEKFNVPLWSTSTATSNFCTTCAYCPGTFFWRSCPVAFWHLRAHLIAQVAHHTLSFFFSMVSGLSNPNWHCQATRTASVPRSPNSSVKMSKVFLNWRESSKTNLVVWMCLHKIFQHQNASARRSCKSSVLWKHCSNLCAQRCGAYFFGSSHGGCSDCCQDLLWIHSQLQCWLLPLLPGWTCLNRPGLNPWYTNISLYISSVTIIFVYHCYVSISIC